MSNVTYLSTIWWITVFHFSRVKKKKVLQTWIKLSLTLGKFSVNRIKYSLKLDTCHVLKQTPRYIEIIYDIVIVEIRFFTFLFYLYKTLQYHLQFRSLLYIDPYHVVYVQSCMHIVLYSDIVYAKDNIYLNQDVYIDCPQSVLI